MDWGFATPRYLEPNQAEKPRCDRGHHRDGRESFSKHADFSSCWKPRIKPSRKVRNNNTNHLLLSQRIDGRI